MYADFSDCKVLQVDDEISYKVYMKKILKIRLNIDLVTASDPSEAFKLLNESDFDLILLDMQMPVLDGYSTLKIIRSNPRTKDTPVICNSALSNLSLIEELIKLKISDFIVKPADENSIIQKVITVLAKKHNSDDIIPEED